MCTVSMVMDGWRDQFPECYPNFYPYVVTTDVSQPPISRAEFQALKLEVQALRDLIKAAQTFDEKTGQPDCHVDERVAFVKKVAEWVGVDLSDLLPNGG